MKTNIFFKYLLSSFLLIISINLSLGQEVSTGTGQWDSNASWVDNTAPDFTINENVDYIINGYITIGTTTVGQDLSFTNTGQNEDFTISDTLVVFGNVNHANKGHNIVIESNAIFIVFGDFTADNKIQIASGGKFIVTGDLSFSNSPQDDYSGSGDLYVFGTTTGNADADAVDQDETAFNNNEDPALVDFVNNRGTNGPLPIELALFELKSSDDRVEINWVTTTEENNDFFSLQRSKDGLNYEAIAKIKGAGNSTDVLTYEFVDENPLFGTSYYRLVQTDLDGTSETFNAKSIYRSNVKELVVQPNPVQRGGKLTVYTGAEEGEVVELSIFSASGTKLINRTVESISEVEIGAGLEPGLYIVKVQSGANQHVKRLLIK